MTDMHFNELISDDALFGEPPTMTAEEADIENKGALVEAFSQTCHRFIELLDELDAEGLLPKETRADHQFWDEVRDQVSTAVYQFDPDIDDHSLEDNS